MGIFLCRAGCTLGTTWNLNALKKLAWHNLNELDNFCHKDTKILLLD